MKRILNNRETPDPLTFDEEIITYPSTYKDYQKEEKNIVTRNFTGEECYKIIRMLDILHKTFNRILRVKRDLKTAAIVNSLLNNTNLYNYLQKIPNKSVPLYDVLFKNDQGIIIWDVKRQGKNETLCLAQLVNPNYTDVRLKPARNNNKSLKKVYKKREGNGELTLDANQWLLPPQSSSSSASSSSAAATQYITVQDYLNNSQDFQPLIFDVLTTPKGGVHRFSLTEGELQIRISESGGEIIAKDTDGNDSFDLSKLGKYDNVLKTIQFLPFFQTYTRQVKTGVYKPHGEISNQKSWLEDNPGGGITPIIHENDDPDSTYNMYCALCGRELVKKGDSYVWDVDHTWNLPLDTVTNVINSPEGYFDTHDTCNRTFKSDKVFVPNIGVWNNLFKAAKNEGWSVMKNSGGAATAEPMYVWPGYELPGLSHDDPRVNKKFNIGYKENPMREVAYSGLQLTSQRINKAIQAEAMHHKDIKQNWGEIVFNEFDLQLKFLKRTLKLTDRLLITDDDDVIIDNLVSGFLNEIILLQAAVENMELYENIIDPSVALDEYTREIQDLIKLIGPSEAARRALVLSLQKRIISPFHLGYGGDMMAPGSVGSEGNEAIYVHLKGILEEADSIMQEALSQRSGSEPFRNTKDKISNFNKIIANQPNMNSQQIRTLQLKIENMGTIIQEAKEREREKEFLKFLKDMERKLWRTRGYLIDLMSFNNAHGGETTSSPGRKMTRDRSRSRSRSRDPPLSSSSSSSSSAAAGAAPRNTWGTNRRGRGRRRGGTRRYKKKKKKTKRRNKKRRKKTKRKRKRRKRTRRKK